MSKNTLRQQIVVREFSQLRTLIGDGKIVLRVCRLCGAVFVVTSGQQRFCCYDHQGVYKQQEYRARLKQRQR